MNRDDITQSNTQVVTYNSVDSNSTIVNVIVHHDNKHGVFTLLSLDENSVSSKQLEAFHSVGCHGNDRVIVIHRIVNEESYTWLLVDLRVLVDRQHQCLPITLTVLFLLSSQDSRCGGIFSSVVSARGI